MNAVSTLVEYLKENKRNLADEIVDQIIHKFGFDVPKEDIDQAKKMYVEFFEFLADSINCEEGSVPEELTDWSKQNGQAAASRGGKISSILIRYPDTRMVFSDFMMELGVKFDLNTKEVVTLLKRVNHMLDISINETVFAYERSHDEFVKNTQAEINELSSPIVPLHEGIAVLPLIGSIDIDRAKHLLDKVVPKIAKQHVECLILDFSGIGNIDTNIARHIFMIYDVLRLLGIRIIFTGIRPDLAQRVIGEGINFTSFEVYANVRQAIESI